MIQQFNHVKHYETVCKWWKGYGQNPVHMDWLPGIGFINDHAACFLVKTDVPLAFIEHLVCDPGATVERDAAIDQVVLACLTYAEAAGFRDVYAMTEIEAVAARAISKFHFKPRQNFILLERSV